MPFPSSRPAALDRLQAFIPLAPLYARDRNRVQPGHPAVSRLSPAIRHRLLLESEVTSILTHHHSPQRIEKFLQELYWNRYWKSWLSLRPQVWTSWLHDPARTDTSTSRLQAETGTSPCAVMNRFARELTSTGYLHNHARMWFAAWWIHVQKLPWQAGADFFLRHLLDACPASNTLSWRWVAGLQTPGKYYLARISNLEKYLDPSWLDPEGLASLDHASPLQPPKEPTPPITAPDLSSDPLPSTRERSGLWIHEEDLTPEISPLAKLHPHSLLLTTSHPSTHPQAPSSLRTGWLEQAITDTSQRLRHHWPHSPLHTQTHSHLPTTLSSWAKESSLDAIVTLRPGTGPLADQLATLRTHLPSHTRLVLIDRPEDLSLRPFASRGFFPFWEKAHRHLLHSR